MEPLKWASNEKVEEAVKMLEKAVNDFSFEPEIMAQELSKLHRTLQQRVMVGFLTWTKRLAKDYQEHRYDARNEVSCKIAKKIVEALEEDNVFFEEKANLPYI